MAKRINRLSAVGVQRITEQGLHPDGAGLYLQVNSRGAKSWIYRFSISGRAREMGLGSLLVVGLADAREKAHDVRRQVAAGVDPIEARKAAKVEQRLQAAGSVTFDEATERFIAVQEAGWRNDKHRQQWRATLRTYASPSIGSTPVADIGTGHITKILDPLWPAKPETASRLRGRIERILDWSRVRGYRVGENPARWRGHLDQLYPSKTKVRPVQHHAAVPIDAIPKVYARLRDADGVAALAARFTILTAARVGMVVESTDAELEKESIWSLAPGRMKSARGFNVPLSTEALAVLDEAKKWRALLPRDPINDRRLFPGHRAGRPLSHTAVMNALRDAGAGHATTHGCRSTFKDWASERTGFSNEVSEMALAHVVGDKTEAAYRRGDLLKKRAALMEAWADFVTGKPS